MFQFPEETHCLLNPTLCLPQSNSVCTQELWHRERTPAAAKSLQSCPTLCDPIDGSPPGSPVPGILQARTLEWVAISFSNAWKWKWKWSRSVVSDPQRPHGLQPTRFLHPWDFPGKSTGVGCHCLLCNFSRPQVFRSVKWTANYLTEVVLAKFCPLYRANI